MPCFVKKIAPFYVFIFLLVLPNCYGLKKHYSSSENVTVNEVTESAYPLISPDRRLAMNWTDEYLKKKFHEVGGSKARFIDELRSEFRFRKRNHFARNALHDFDDETDDETDDERFDEIMKTYKRNRASKNKQAQRRPSNEPDLDNMVSTANTMIADKYKFKVIVLVILQYLFKLLLLSKCDF